MADDEDKLFGKAGRVRPIMPTLGPRDQQWLLDLLKLEGDAGSNFADALRRLARQWVDDVPSLELRTILLLTADLYEQGWSIRLAPDHFLFEPPGLTRGEASIREVKHRVQRSLQVGRERQLREPSVRQFIARMERTSPRAGGASASIFDLIDDGNALADALAAVRELPASKRKAALRKVINPVVEYCEAGARCADTGLNLIDIWRYFRHTWSHEYRSIPGRQMMVLIRNAARPKRPVIGIAMLASPVMRLHARDSWIGWLRPAAEERVASGAWKPREFVRALSTRLDLSIGDIRWDDLASADEIEAPTEAVVFRLQQKAFGAAYQRDIELRARYGAEGDQASRRDPVSGDKETTDWRAASEDLLFVRKRAEGLAELLFAKVVFAEFDLKRPTTRSLAAMFASKRGQR
ncbi:MAG: Druantia anti-phage system protein DruA, partial [Flavobacteriaceae bacterium]